MVSLDGNNQHISVGTHLFLLSFFFFESNLTCRSVLYTWFLHWKKVLIRTSHHFCKMTHLTGSAP